MATIVRPAPSRLIRADRPPDPGRIELAADPVAARMGMRPGHSQWRCAMSTHALHGGRSRSRARSFTSQG